MARTTRKPSTSTTATKTPTTRSEARKVYMAVLDSAVNTSDVVEITGMDRATVGKLLKQLERRGLVGGTHVNSEMRLTWQSNFDIENEADALANGKAQFAEFWPAKDKGTTRPGGGGARYTPEQLKKAKAAKAKGGTRKEVAAAAGIASPNYLAKLLRRMAQEEAKAAKPARKRTRKATTKAAA